MPAINLSAKNAQQKLNSCAKSVEYMDTNGRGDTGKLGIRISPKDKRTWFICFRSDGSRVKKKFTIGSYPAIKYTAAKKKANSLLQKIADGGCPIREKREAVLTGELAGEQDMNALWEEYRSLPKFKKKVASTRKEEARKWKQEIEPLIGSVPVKDITPVMINKLLKKKAQKSEVSANRLYSFLRILFKPALQDGWITVHPMQHLEKVGVEKTRDRVLTDEEIVAVWNHMDNVSENAAGMLKLLLLTAQRPGEIAAMKHEDINEGVWHQVENKTDTINLVPLSEQALSVVGHGEGYVFASNYGKAGHAQPNVKDRRQIQKDSDVVDWTSHDLRRTARTLMSRLNIKQHIRERVLNHAQGGVTGVYDQYDYLPEKRQALDKLGREIDRILGIDVDTKVVLLRRQA